MFLTFDTIGNDLYVAQLITNIAEAFRCWQWRSGTLEQGNKKLGTKAIGRERFQLLSETNVESTHANFLTAKKTTFGEKAY